MSDQTPLDEYTQLIKLRLRRDAVLRRGALVFWVAAIATLGTTIAYFAVDWDVPTTWGLVVIALWLVEIACVLIGSHLERRIRQLAPPPDPDFNPWSVRSE